MKKYKLALLSLMLILVTSASTTINFIPTTIIMEVISGIVAIFGIYCGANVANKYVLGKTYGPRMRIESPEQDFEQELEDFRQEKYNGMDRSGDETDSSDRRDD